MPEHRGLVPGLPIRRILIRRPLWRAGDDCRDIRGKPRGDLVEAVEPRDNLLKLDLALPRRDQAAEAQRFHRCNEGCTAPGSFALQPLPHPVNLSEAEPGT